jgi:crotonobetainyl-CoA:carnitine CoA-transferase CaiB-like acyl-CoA transferase
MLSHLKVVELATMVAAPAAAGLLADYGAQVIKIEPHRGDPMRGAPGSPLGSINFDLHNRNKRSIALSTGVPESRDVILRLVLRSDVFITNMLPDQLQKLRLDWETLHALHGRLVYGSVSSFGQGGPHKNRGATDNLGFWARAGGTGLLTVEGQDPLPIRQSVGDRFTGALACAGILAGVVQAQSTGIGVFVDTSLLSAGMWAFSTDVANYMNKGRTTPSKSRREAVMPLANYFRTRDGRWIQVHTTIAQLAPALGQPELAEDPRFTGRASRDHNGTLVDIIDALVGQSDYDDLAGRFEAASVRYEPVNAPAELARDPQVVATERLVEIGEKENRHWQVANPWTVVMDGGQQRQADSSSPGIGEHTREILAELKYSEADIARMEASGVILRRQ